MLRFGKSFMVKNLITLWSLVDERERSPPKELIGTPRNYVDYEYFSPVPVEFPVFNRMGGS